MNNPFKEVYDVILESSNNDYRARSAAKALYADWVRSLYGIDVSTEYLLQKFEEYTLQLNEVLKP
jgi:hypothetical protein